MPSQRPGWCPLLLGPTPDRIKPDWEALESKGKQRGKEGGRLQRRGGRLYPQSGLPPSSPHYLPAQHDKEGVPAAQFQGEMRQGAEAPSREASGGHPEEAGMRTRDRDENGTRSHEAASKVAATLQKLQLSVSGMTFRICP